MSDKGYTAALNFYTSHSGWYDELSWAGAWIYLADGDETYLEKLKVCDKWPIESQTTYIAYSWVTAGTTFTTEQHFFWQRLQTNPYTKKR